MANNKTGFDYYNTDTDRYQDIRIKRLKKDFGCSGIAVYDYILCEIYRVKGCFIAWDESTAFDVAEYFGIKESLVNEIVNYCGVVGLFDKGLLTSGSILTSLSIQKRYLEMCNRAKRINYFIPDNINLLKLPEEYAKLPEESTIIQELPLIIPISSDKVKKSKVNIKEENLIKDEFERFRKFYPGIKRGFETEFVNFMKKHKDYPEVVFLLYPAIERLIQWREIKRAAGKFVPEYANLQTWINQRRWEVELETTELNHEQKTSTYQRSNGARLQPIGAMSEREKDYSTT